MGLDPLALRRDVGVPPRALHDLLDAAAKSGLSRSAVSDLRGTWTYRELTAASERFADWLRRSSVRTGDRVVLIAAATRELVAAVYGCSRVGVTAVPLHPSIKPFQLKHLLTDAAPALIVTDQVDRLAHVRPGIQDICAAWTSDPRSGPSEFEAAPPPVAAHPPSGGAPALLLYTSGSTSPVPKAVVCPVTSVLFAADAISRRLGYRANDVVFCRVPLSFDYGLYQVFLAAYAGAELVLRGPESDSRLLPEIRATGATIVPLVPSIAAMLLRMAIRDAAATAVRLFTNTGEELPAALLAGLRERFPAAGIQLMFGTTECKRIAIMECDGDLVRPGSVGRPLDGTEVVIVDGAGNTLPAGEQGEIVVRGPHVMTGYWRAPELTALTFRGAPGADGNPAADSDRPNLYTGDFGHLDQDGYLYFHSRRDNIFKCNGVRTSTAEIEAATLDIPGVTGAAAFPPVHGLRDAVLVVSGAMEPLEVRRELARRLEAAKVPGVCHVVPELPHNSNGKVDRGRLLAELGSA